MAPEKVCELWQGQPVQAARFSASDVRNFAALGGRKLFWTNVAEYVGGAFAIAAFAFYIWHFKEWGVKVGSAVMILTVIYVLAQRARWLRSGRLRHDVAETGCLVSYLRELERIRYYSGNLWKFYWGPLCFAFVVFFFAVSTESWALAMAPWSWLLNGSFTLLIIAVTMKVARRSRKYVEVLDQAIAGVKAMLT